MISSMGGRAILLAAGLMAGALVVNHAGSGQTMADTSITHAGPLVALSNGHAVGASTTISDVQSNVKEIDYTVHGPAGTSVSGTQFGKTWPNCHTRVRYLADQPSGTYSITARVTTATTGSAAGVSLRATVQNRSTGKAVSASKSGVENASVQSTVFGI